MNLRPIGKAYLYNGRITQISGNKNLIYVSGDIVIGKEGETGPTIIARGYTAINIIRGTNYIYSGYFETNTSGNVIKASGGTINISGGEFVTNNASSIIGGKGAIINISGGKYKSNDLYCIEQASGNITISDGDFFSNKNYLLKTTGGTYTLSGGKFNENEINESVIEK